MFLLMALVSVISLFIVTYAHVSEDIKRNLPDCQMLYIDNKEDQIITARNIKHSIDDDCEHYRGSAILSSNSGYAADVMIQKYKFENEEQLLRQRLLHSADKSDDS